MNGNLFLYFCFKKFIKKAVATFAINDWSTDSLHNEYPALEQKIQEAWLPVSLLPKLEWVDLSETRSELTQGNNYFLSFKNQKRKDE